MATSPPALETLTVASIRETTGLPPLEQLQSALQGVQPAVNRPPSNSRPTGQWAPPPVAPPASTDRIDRIWASGPIQYKAVTLDAPTSITGTVLPGEIASKAVVSSVSTEVIAGSSASPATAPEQLSFLPPAPVVSNEIRVPLTSTIPQFPVGLEIDLGFKKTLAREIPSSEILVRKKGYYIVPWADKFFYYKIPEVVSRSEHLFQFVRKPATLKEGLVFINKEMYYVTLDDLRRGIIRKSRKVEIKVGTTYADLLARNTSPVSSPSQPTNTDSSEARAVAKPYPIKVSHDPRGKDFNGLIADFGVEVCKEADLAFEVQSRALLDLVSEEEGEDWIIEEAA